MSAFPSFSCFSNPSNCAFLCFGNIDRGDDAIGLIIARELKKQSLKYIFSEEEEDPFNLLVEIGKNPDIHFVIIIDAIDFGAQPGTLFVSKTFDDTVKYCTTHKIPLNQIKEILNEYGKPLIFIGIQVSSSINLMDNMSDSVKNSVERVIKLFNFKNITKDKGNNN